MLCKSWPISIVILTKFMDFFSSIEMAHLISILQMSVLILSIVKISIEFKKLKTKN